MLILSRGQDQAIRIGDDIRIVVTRIAGDKVKIGFEAPSSVKIHREEIYYRIAHEGERG